VVAVVVVASRLPRVRLNKAAAAGRSLEIKALLAEHESLRTHTHALNEATVAASAGGHRGAVDLLLEEGASPDATDSYGLTALIHAASLNRSTVAAALLDHGAAIDRTGKDGRTALWYAAYSNSVEAAALLLDRGAHVDARDSSGETPLMMAAARGHLDAARLLLERGADPSREDRLGTSALTRARLLTTGEMATLLEAHLQRQPAVRPATTDGPRR
jgi:ankyrin repeat protein